MWKYFACLIGLRTIAPLPPRLGYFLTRIISDLCFLLSPKARDGIISNAMRSLGPKADQASINHVTLEVFRNAARNTYDLLTLPRFNLPSVERNLTFHGWHHFEDAISRGMRGYIDLHPHGQHGHSRTGDKKAVNKANYSVQK